MPAAGIRVFIRVFTGSSSPRGRHLQAAEKESASVLPMSLVRKAEGGGRRKGKFSRDRITWFMQAGCFLQRMQKGLKAIGYYFPSDIPGAGHGGGTLPQHHWVGRKLWAVAAATGGGHGRRRALIRGLDSGF